MNHRWMIEVMSLLIDHSEDHGLDDVAKALIEATERIAPRIVALSTKGLPEAPVGHNPIELRLS